MIKESKLHDLVEFRFDYILQSFVKVKTHLYNKPKSLCYGEKKQLEANYSQTKSTIYVVVPNGTYQYTNQFKSKKK